MDGFRFEIGDVVMTRSGVADAMLKCRVGERSMPFHFVVCERIAQECPGGVQRHYRVSGDSGPHQMLEVELAAPGEFDWLAAGAALDEAEVRRQTAWSRQQAAVRAKKPAE